MCKGGGRVIGKYGKVIFSVSDKRIQTFDNFSMEVSAKWSEIQRMGYKPLLEYTGRNLRTVKFEMILNVKLGVPVRKMLKRLEKMAESRHTRTLIIGNKRIGRNKWVIKKFDENLEHIMSKGEMVQAKVNIELTEYIEKKKLPLIKKKKKKKNGSKKIRNKRKGNLLSQIAKEVIRGKWGNGKDRKLRLERAGYNYKMVQKVVNRMLRKTKGKK